jgi:hypothetical protein
MAIVDYSNEPNQSRVEEILQATINGSEYDKPAQSRVEYLLKELKELIESGGSSDEYGASIVASIDSLNYVLSIALKNKEGDTLGQVQTIDLPLESTVVNGSYNSQSKSLILTLVSGQTITIPISDLIAGLQAEITAQNKLSADLVDDANATNKFITAAEKAQIATNANDISDLQSTIGDINTALEEVL